MHYWTLIFFALLGVSLYGQNTTINSPGGQIELKFSMSEDGEPQYSVSYKGKGVIKKSLLGLQFAEGSLKSNLELTGKDTITINETWNPVLGEVKSIRNHYKQLIVKLKEKGALPKEMDIHWYRSLRVSTRIYDHR